MRKRNFTILTILFVLICSVFAVQAQTKRKKDNRNVLDYYKLVPINILGMIDAKVEIQDNKNGYLKIRARIGGWHEAALYRRRDRSAVLVIGETLCQPVCSTTLHAYQMIDGKMVDVTKKLIPRRDENIESERLRREDGEAANRPITHKVLLPRYGKTIDSR